MSKKIFVAPPYHTEIINYTSWLEANNLPYELCSNIDDLGPKDLLLLCGGGDIAKKKERDDYEFRLLGKAQNQGNKVVGICRGMQISNVFLGGDLITELDDKSHIPHRLRKSLNVDKESSFHMVFKIPTGDRMLVNSRHHQSVKSFGEGLKPTSKSSDGVFESAISQDGRYHLVQWHPEREEVRDLECSKQVIQYMKNWLYDSKNTECDGCGIEYYEPNPKYEFGEYNVCDKCKNNPNIIFE